MKLSLKATLRNMARRNLSLHTLRLVHKVNHSVQYHVVLQIEMFHSTAWSCTCLAVRKEKCKHMDVEYKSVFCNTNEYFIAP